ncbi:MAG: glycosyltransferase [Clostridia bacterium]|nr:glycosyltransferase [Clostridia bacterium]
MKIGILGHFARGTELCDGQTTKTRNLEKALLNEKEEFLTVDSYRWKKHPFSFFFKVVRLARKSDVIIMLPASGSVKIYTRIINLFGKKKVKIYSVIGAWLPSLLENKKGLKKQLKKFDYIFSETKTMQKKLEAQGFNNVVTVPNFKDITPINEKEIKYDFEEPLPLCIFSRILKQKGIGDAICACDRLNKEAGKNVCTLNIHGPVSEDYKEEFSNLCEEYSSFVQYKGVVDPSKSVEALKGHYMLLFPTLFYTEGVPGTIIDAFSAGVPVLASEWESYADVLSEKDSITYRFADTEDLYAKLKYCVENIEKINGYRAECLKSAEKFSLDTITKQIWDLICSSKR